MSSDSRFVLLVKWSNGTAEQLEIPAEPWPGLGCALVEVGPPEQEPAAGSITLYAPNSRTVIGKVLVHGDELPSMLVCPAPDPEPKTETDLAPVCARCDSDRPGPCEDCPELATLVPDDARRVPEWLAEAMSELASRHDLRSTEGNEQAMAAAVRMLDDYELRRQACASLARGYRSCASALAAAHDGDETASASHHEAAGRHFREALELARKAEELAA